jgi:hypothetical protein
MYKLMYNLQGERCTNFEGMLREPNVQFDVQFARRTNFEKGAEHIN